MVVTDVSTDVSHLEDGKRRKVMQGFSLADVSTLPELQTKSETISSPEFDTKIIEARPISLIYNPNYGYDTDVSVSPVRPVNGFSKDDDFSLTPKKKKKTGGKRGRPKKGKIKKSPEKSAREWEEERMRREAEKYVEEVGGGGGWSFRMLEKLRKAFNKGSRDIRDSTFWDEVSNDVGMSALECENKWNALLGQRRELTDDDRRKIVRKKRMLELERNNMGDSVYDTTPRKKIKIDNIEEEDFFGSAIKASPAGERDENVLEEESEGIFGERVGVDWGKVGGGYLEGFGQRRR
ncbi:hypothetical protein TrLO_g1724 [Triparma laevis f. longispina]|nr:hypothetical protein TrLO_g1724 [Triparma laevis f. longispina]